MLLMFMLCRCSAVRCSGHWQDAPGSSLCRPDQVDLPEAGRTPAGADVHRRRSQAGARCLRSGQRKVTCYCLHWWAGCHWSVFFSGGWGEAGGRGGGLEWIGIYLTLSSSQGNNSLLLCSLRNWSHCWLAQGEREKLCSILERTKSNKYE